MKHIHLVIPAARPRAHRVLFDRDLPFRGRREQNRQVYQRRPKHPHRNDQG